MKNNRLYEFYISQLPILFFMFVLASCPIMGQQGPAQSLLQPKDYDMWHHLRYNQISGDGLWASYKMDYEKATDTLFVLSLDGKSEYQFPNAHSGQFQPNKKTEYFAFKPDQKGIGILNLSTGETVWEKEAERFEFDNKGNFLALYNPQPNEGYLKLWDLERNQSIILKGITAFKFDPLGKRAVLISKDSTETAVTLLRLRDMRQSVIVSSKNTDFLHPTWNESGDGFVFMESTPNKGQRLYYFEDKKTPMLRELDAIDLLEYGRLEISTLQLSFSKDGERIFFWTHRAENDSNDKEKDSLKVQVWKGTDKWIYPRQQSDWEFNKADRLAVWWPKTKKVFQIGTAERPEVILVGDEKYALTYNVLQYEPQYKQAPQSDFYITNLGTGETSLFVKELETALGYLNIDPSGRHIAYFKNGDWWLYDIKNKTHINSTENLPYPLTYQYAPHSSAIVPFGSMRWTTTGDFLVYDEFDIWKTGAGTKNPKRLTNGREKNIHYREYKGLYDGFRSLTDIARDKPIDLSKTVILAMQDSLFNQGYALLEPSDKVKDFINENGRISELRKAKFTDSFIYVKEKNDAPPSLWKKSGDAAKLLAQSNKQQQKYLIGNTELITYTNAQGEKLHGILHYPDNYEAGKQYPMIVHVYEMIGYKYQQYHNPSYYNGAGYNYRNFTAEGYFVLEPDILIQKGNPGVSATDCVTRAVNAVLDKGFVNKDALGLIGHSFGGYETAFIISQTNMFVAAVVGSGVFDLTTTYHTINRDTGRAEHWHYENQQWQMGQSFYEGKELYKRNSPVEYAQNIKTPTLIWTGNKDYQVNWHQSEAMYLALRRLNREVELRIYENEGHSLVKGQNQKDLTERILKWFNTYLKKESKGNI